MEAIATKNNVGVTPRKVRLVLDLVRGKSVQEALAICANTNKAASREVTKIIQSAVGNAINNHRMVEDKLFIKEIQAGDGMTLKRFATRAKGSSARILKRTSNIRVVVGERG